MPYLQPNHMETGYDSKFLNKRLQIENGQSGAYLTSINLENAGMFSKRINYK
jgi:hypothetical protein